MRRGLPGRTLLGRGLVGVLALLALGCAGWRIRADRVADALFDDPRAAVRWADAVAEAVGQGVEPGDFSTGSDLFDGEHAVITCSLAVLGLVQVAGDDAALRDRYRDPVARCATFLASPEGRAFGAVRWGEDPLQAPPDHGHAYAGWIAVALAASREVAPDPAVDATSRALLDHLAAALDALGPTGLETYPGELYPTDQAAVMAAVRLDGRHDAALDRFLDRWWQVAIDPGTGLQHQALIPGSGQVADGVRGSGSAISAWFLSYADPVRGRVLARAVERELRGSVLGFGGVREVPRGAPFRMDIDSGPVVPGFGFGVAASGFGLANARLLGDRGLYRSCFRSAHLFGMPLPGGRWYWAGGTIGNAVLLAAATGPGAGPELGEGPEPAEPGGGER